LRDTDSAAAPGRKSRAASTRRPSDRRHCAPTATLIHSGRCGLCFRPRNAAQIRGERPMRRLFRWLPLPGLLIVIYLVVAYIQETAFAATLVSLTLPSNHVWTIDVRDLFLVAALFVLYVEIFKSTRTNAAEIMEHTFAFLTLVASLLIFLLVPRAGTSLFGLLTLTCAIDVIAGFTVTIAAARRSIEVERS
jgi:hypothetical protein